MAVQAFPLDVHSGTGFCWSLLGLLSSEGTNPALQPSIL